MKAKIQILTIGLLMTILDPTLVFASSEKTDHVNSKLPNVATYITPHQAVTSDPEEVSTLLAQENIDSVTLLLPASHEESQEEPADDWELKWGVPAYRVVNVRTLPQQTDASPFTAVIGEPGMTLGIQQNQTVQTTLSSSFGASTQLISAQVGWTVTGSRSVLVSTQFKVPAKKNGRLVKTCRLSAHAIRDRKSFAVDKKPWNSGQWGRQGTGYTGKAKAVQFKISYTYR